MRVMKSTLIISFQTMAIAMRRCSISSRRLRNGRPDWRQAVSHKIQHIDVIAMAEGFLLGFSELNPTTHFRFVRVHLILIEPRPNSSSAQFSLCFILFGQSLHFHACILLDNPRSDCQGIINMTDHNNDDLVEHRRKKGKLSNLKSPPNPIHRRSLPISKTKTRRKRLV